MSMEVDQNAESYIARLLHRRWPPQSHHPHRRSAPNRRSLEKAATFSTLKADCVEWRADWFPAPFPMLHALAHVPVTGSGLPWSEKLLLVTFRTQAEGGKKPRCAQEEYAGILHDGLCLWLCRPAGH